jgi:hypothetical protein
VSVTRGRELRLQPTLLNNRDGEARRLQSR